METKFLCSLKGFCCLLALLCSLSLFSQTKGDFCITVSGTEESPRLLATTYGDFSFQLPRMSGCFRLGIACNGESKWLKDTKVSMKRGKGSVTYTVIDELLGKGKIELKVAKLSDSDGFVMEVVAEKLPENASLCWAFGGCYDLLLEEKSDGGLKPEYCAENIFVVEGNNLLTYFGNAHKLQTILAVFPTSETCLSDAHQQETPLKLFASGKETDAPVLSAITPLSKDKKVYFCFYKQNQKADYTYYMMPALFEKEWNINN